MEQIELVNEHFCKPDEWFLDDQIAMSQGHLYNPTGNPSGRATLISLAVGAAAQMEGYRRGPSLLILPKIDHEAYEHALGDIAASVGYEGPDLSETIHALPGVQDVHLVEPFEDGVKPTHKVFELISVARDLQVCCIGLDYIEEFFPAELCTNDIIGTTLHHIAMATEAAVIGFKTFRPHVVH